MTSVTCAEAGLSVCDALAASARREEKEKDQWPPLLWAQRDDMIVFVQRANGPAVLAARAAVELRATTGAAECAAVARVCLSPLVRSRGPPPHVDGALDACWAATASCLSTSGDGDGGEALARALAGLLACAGPAGFEGAEAACGGRLVAACLLGCQHSHSLIGFLALDVAGVLRDDAARVLACDVLTVRLAQLLRTPRAAQLRLWLETADALFALDGGAEWIDSLPGGFGHWFGRSGEDAEEAWRWLLALCLRCRHTVMLIRCLRVRALAHSPCLVHAGCAVAGQAVGR
jgi:hypothetical protein